MCNRTVVHACTLLLMSSLALADSFNETPKCPLVLPDDLSMVDWAPAKEACSEHFQVARGMSILLGFATAQHPQGFTNFDSCL